MELIRNVAAIVGCVLSCTSLLVLVCKPIQKFLIAFITRQSGKTEMQTQISEMQAQISEIRDMLLEHLETDKLKQINAENDREALLCLLRNSVTRIYYSYLPQKQIPAHEYKNMIFLSDAYIKLGGNSYIGAIVEKMNEWDVLSD